MTNRFGIHMPEGEGPLFDEMRAVAGSVADTVFVPGQALTDASIFTPSSAWTLTSVEMRQWLGPLYSLRIVASYASGTAITVPADGNIPNSVIATFLPEYRPVYNAPMQSYFTGPAAVGGVSSTTGAISLGAVTPGTVISNVAPFSVDLAGLMLCPQMPW